VKFNERCFVRLLGDMRSYNFVVLLTPISTIGKCGFARWIRSASYNGRKNFYLPQFFKENTPLVNFCIRHCARNREPIQTRRAGDHPPARASRVRAPRPPLARHEPRSIAPREKIVQLREELAALRRKDYLRCESMGALVRENLESIRRETGRPIVPELVPE